MARADHDDACAGARHATKRTGGTGRFCGEGKMMGQRSLLLTDLLHGSFLTAFSLSFGSVDSFHNVADLSQYVVCPST